MSDLPDVLLRLIGVVGLLSVSSLVWLVVRRSSRTFHATRRPQPALTGERLHHALGTRATFVQFSSATCSSCPQVRRVLADLARSEGVVHIDVDAEEHMDLVRRHGVRRTPTVLLLDADGEVRFRHSGPLTAPAALAALTLLDAASHPGEPADHSPSAPTTLEPR